MKQLSQLALAFIVATGTVACGANDRAEDRTDPTAIGAPGAGTVGTAGGGELVRADRDFLEEMLADSSAEVELGRLAQERASNPMVREFAAMMVRDHTEAGEELKQVAAGYNMHTSAEAYGQYAALRDRLATLSGADFDREYMDALVDDHQKAVNEARDRAENAESPEVKAWAGRTLPTLERHLARAKEIRDELQQSPRNRR